MMRDIKSTLAGLVHEIESRAEDNRTFIDFDSFNFSYRQLQSAVHQTAGLFRHKKLAQNSRIIIFTHDDVSAVTIFMTALLDGITPVMLSPETKSNRLKSIIDKVDPQHIFIDAAFLQLWPWITDLNYTGILDQSAEGGQGHYLVNPGNQEPSPYYPALLAHCEKHNPRCSSGNDDIAYIVFSSGTTSAPKGICITYGNLFSHLKTLMHVFSYSPKSLILNNMDISHADGLIQGPMLALYSGAGLFRPPPFAIQNLDKLIARMAFKRVSHFITVPTILSLINRLIKRGDYFSYPDFETIISVAAKLDSTLWSQLQEKFNIRICNIYGLSETVAGGLFCGPNDLTFQVGSVGKPVDVASKIIDEKGRECRPGVEGELCLQGDSITPGYLDEPEASAQLFTEDGWLKTGDIAIRDEYGFYEIVGRKKSIIISGGFNIHPDEVTETLLLHPSIIDAATVGIQDRDWGELVASAVEAKVLVDETGVINHCRMNLESYKIPKKIIQVKKLPRGISGKVQLPAVKEVLENRSPAKTVESTVDIGEILTIAATVFDSAESLILPDAPPDDIPGWDSLGHLNLVTAVEKKFDIEIDVDDIMRIDCLQTLQGIVKRYLRESLTAKPQVEIIASTLKKDDLLMLQKVIASSTIGKKKPGSLLLGHNTQKEMTPIFWCFNARDLELAGLAKHLPGEQSIYALYSGSGIMDRKIPVEKLAEYYISEISLHDHTEKILLGGHCRGGAVAWHMAQILEEQGRSVDKLCILEYFSPEMFAKHEADMILLYGEDSPFKFPEGFRWREEGWQAQFATPPQVKLIPGSHGDEFFRPPYIEVLADEICSFFQIQKKSDT